MRISENLKEADVKGNSFDLDLNNGDFIHYDLSKTHCTEDSKVEIKNKILNSDLNLKIEGMKCGKNINYTEKRPVLHYLLREEGILKEVEARLSNQESTNAKRAKTNEFLDSIKEEVIEELIKISSFTNEFKSMCGITGKPLKNIVNIGIGGSDLGPRMITSALEYYSQGSKVYFISNIDPSETLKVFKEIDVESTLFIVVSKTFTTIETIENFKFSLGLIKESLSDQFTEEQICNKHFVAVSSNVEEVSKYGIEVVFKMWDFVGGRYSLWSAVGLSISLYIGFNNYLRLLKGASVADKDFFENKIESVSGKLAVNELFYISKGYNNKCIVCYDSYLSLMYKYMQQAEMESNGKHGSKQMIIWGGVGTDVQHSFFQLLHQGEQDIYLEFLCPIKNISTECDFPKGEANKNQIKYQHKLLTAACLAQSMSMMEGKHSKDINVHYEGNKPSVTIMYSKLTPETLGAMVAVYEHKIFIEGIYFNINSFDQFGVSLGKTIATELIKEMDQEEPSSKIDQSTLKLIKYLRKK